MVRYADDFVLLCRDAAEVQAALSVLEHRTAGAGLSLHPDKTYLVDYASGHGFDLLGYHFKQGRRRPSAKKHEEDTRGHPHADFIARGLSTQGHARVRPCQSSLRQYRRTERRVRENRTHGSEGEGPRNRFSLPLSTPAKVCRYLC